MPTDTTRQIQQRKCRNVDEIPSPAAPEIIFRQLLMQTVSDDNFVT